MENTFISLIICKQKGCFSCKPFFFSFFWLLVFVYGSQGAYKMERHTHICTNPWKMWGSHGALVGGEQMYSQHQHWVGVLMFPEGWGSQLSRDEFGARALLVLRGRRGVWLWPCWSVNPPNCTSPKESTRERRDGSYSRSVFNYLLVFDKLEFVWRLFTWFLA